MVLEVVRQNVEKGKVVKCQEESCGRLIYPGMTYVIVTGKEVDGKKILCETCFENLGWKYAKTM